MSFINLVNTKLEAYLLINDPTKLLSMLYSKYGDIDEDRDLLYINQIIYNKKTLLNCLFKEYQIIYNYNDFLKRYYRYFECIKRLPKLSDYYKNYYLFFCKPFLKDFKMTKLIQINGNHKAEIFYKNNYESLTKNEDNETEKIKENSLYSFDNITNNKTIFDQKIKNIIENSSSKITLSLEGSEINKGNYNLLTKRSNDESFLISINNLFNDKKEKKFNNNLNNNKNLYFPQKHKFFYKNKIKSSIYNLSKNSYRTNIEKDNKSKKSLSPSFYHNKKSNIDGFNKLNSKINLKLNNPRNKTRKNSKNLNSNLSNFEKLSSTINNNHNSINNSKTMRLSLNNNNNNKNQEKNTSRQILIPNTYSVNSNSKNKPRKNTNITFEKNSSNQNNKIEKFNSNFLNFNNTNNLTIKSQKRNFGSKFNLVKNALNSIQVNTNKNNIINPNKLSNFSLTKNQTYYKNHSKTNNNSNVSLSLNKSKKKDKSITQEKNHKNNLNKKRNKSNFDSNALSNRKNLKYSINNKIFYPSNNYISNFRIYMKLNNINISSRNKKESITKQNQTNIKSLRKDIRLNSKSIDEDKLIINNIISHLDNKKVSGSDINQNIINQLDELIKKPKYSNHYRFNINTMSSPNLNNEKPNHQRFNDDINNLNHFGNNLTIKRFKPVNITLNKNKIDKNEKKQKIVLSKYKNY